MSSNPTGLAPLSEEEAERRRGETAATPSQARARRTSPAGSAASGLRSCGNVGPRASAWPPSQTHGGD